MWWQILPPLAVISVCYGSIFVTMPIIHYVFKGRPTNRGLTEYTHIEFMQKHGFKRDVSLTGEEHRSWGLDNIPDE